MLFQHPSRKIQRDLELIFTLQAPSLKIDYFTAFFGVRNVILFIMYAYFFVKVNDNWQMDFQNIFH